MTSAPVTTTRAHLTMARAPVRKCARQPGNTSRLAYVVGIVATLACLCWSPWSFAVDVEVQLSAPLAPDFMPGVIWLRALGDAPFKPAHEQHAIVDQINKQFSPRVSVVELGTAVTFPNKDNIRHHVYSFSEAKPFELKLYSGMPSHPVVFDKVGVVTLGCNIHDVMLGYVLVVDTTFHALGNRQGLAQIVGVPAGDYLLYAWVPGELPGQRMSRKVHIGSETPGSLHLDMRGGSPQADAR